MEDLTDVYNDLIMEHSMNSYNKKKLENADYSEIGHNPNCGDEITLELKLNGDKIEDMAFSGHGCAISQASTSIMIDTLRGKTIEEAKEIIKTFIEMIKREITDEEQLKKLELKVHSLLYLNKLNYIQDKKDNLNVQYDVSITINAAVDKFKMSRPDVEFVLDIDKKSTIFRGNADMWEAIIDNILNNFMRYAKKQVKITVKNNKIILYNDGDVIDEKVLNNIFTPYEKGVNGVFGLGLSIVKKTLHFLNYDISIENVKNGVKFTIY